MEFNVQMHGELDEYDGSDDVWYEGESGSPTPVYNELKSKPPEFGYGGGKRKRFGDDDDMREMWDTVAPEDGQERRLVNNDNFIDDSVLDPSTRYYGSDNESRLHPFADGEEDEDIKEMFKISMKKKKKRHSAAEISFHVENILAKLELAAEEDAELNRRDKPAINKLRKLPLLIDVLSKKQLQQEFLDHGVLSILKNWLEPLPDGSLPNITLRAAILKILSDLPIDLEQYDRREQLKKSGLGKVIVFFSKSGEETPSNRKLAKELVEQWVRHIFTKSTRFEDMRSAEDERDSRRPSNKKYFSRPSNKNRTLNRERGNESMHDDLDIPHRPIADESSSRLRALRPEAMPMDFVVRPQSKVDYEEVRERARQMMPSQKHLKINKKMQELKGPKKRQLQAIKLSVEGRGMVKYL